LLGAGDRAAAKAAIERAAGYYDAAGAALDGPGTLLALAKLEREDGNGEAARQHVDRALAWLARLPRLLTSGRMLRDKLVALRDALAPPPSAR
jgi:hypothetical protein